MLCEGCQDVLKLIPTIKDGSLLLNSNIWRIYSSMRLEKCFICSALSQWMFPQKKYQGIFMEALTALQNSLPLSARDLQLGYSVRIRTRPQKDGVEVFDNVLQIQCKFEEELEFEAGNQLTFFFSAIEPDQVADGTIRLNTEEDGENNGSMTLKPNRPLRSDNCPYCKENVVDQTDETIARDYFGDTEPVGEGIKCSLVLDTSIDTQFKSDNTGSEQSWPQIKEWLQICSADHKECRARLEAAKEMKYPTRLLDLGLTGEEEGDLRLVLSREETLTGEYMTLSHCWGNSPTIILTSDNLPSFQNKIPFSSLTKTFQDAVVITRKLSIRYLWIDSLCIVQAGEGVKQDWHRESATMDSVYLNSFLNIGATGAPDGRAGCFQERDYENVFRPIVLKPECKLHCTKYRQPYRLVEESFLQDTLLSEPLLKRGWVFQERFLSPRMLHFGSEQLFWECSEMLVCESYPHNLVSAPPLVSLDRLDPERVPGLDKIIVPLLGNYRWYHILGEYTSKKLTRGQDKLIALSGVARQYAARMLPAKGTYWAGIWAANLPQDLLWMTEDKDSERPSEWRAPSWSWASLDGKIESPFGGHMFEAPLAKIFDAEIELFNPSNEFGAVASALIPVQGRLLTLGSCTREENRYGLTYEDCEIEHSRWYPDELVYEQAETVICLAVAFGADGLVGLTLEKEEGSSDRYLRTGAFRIWPAAKTDAPLDWINDMEPFDILHGLSLDEKDSIQLI